MLNKTNGEIARISHFTTIFRKKEINVVPQSSLSLFRRRYLWLKQEGEVGVTLQEEGNNMSLTNIERRKVEIVLSAPY